MSYERDLIAACLKDPSRIDIAAGIVAPGDFAELGDVWGVLVMMREAGMSIQDPAILKATMTKRVRDTRWHELSTWTALLDIGMPWNVKFYADDIRDKALIVEHAKILNVASQRLMDGTTKAMEVNEWLQSRLEQLSSRTQSHSRHVSEVVDDVVDELKKGEERATSGIMTGLEDFDTTIGRVRDGEMMVVAARPGIGKTAFACQVALHNAGHNRNVWIATLEMEPIELTKRLVCGMAAVDGKRWRGDHLQEYEKQQLIESSSRLWPMPIWLWKKPRPTFSQLRSEARLINSANKLSLIVVDYIGLLEKEDSRIEQHEHIGECAKRLKQLASEIKCVVICLCQLTRAADKDKPNLGMLSQSSGIEQNADTVFFLHTDTPNHERVERYPITVTCGKNRHGTQPSFNLTYVAKETRFETIAAKVSRPRDDFSMAVNNDDEF